MQFIIPNQIDEEVRSLENSVYVASEAYQNLTPLKKELLQGNFRLGYIRFQHVKWLIRAGIIKVQVNSKAETNFERTNCAACDFVNGFFTQ